jgi:hypothetical protein
VADNRLSDDEVVYRRILTKDLRPQNRIPPPQFKLRKDEEGVSVNRAALISRRAVIAQGDARFEYHLAQAAIGAIRQLTADDGTHLQLEVIPTRIDEDPSHAEIRGPVAGVLPEGAPRQLARLFQNGFPIPLDEQPSGNA